MDKRKILGFERFMIYALFCALLAGVMPADVDQGVLTPIPPELVVQTGHLGQVAALAFSPDGRWLASGGADKKIRVWDVASGYEWRTYLGGHWATVIAFDPTARYLVSGDRENAVTVWELSTGDLLYRMAVPRPGPVIIVKAIGFSADGRILASVHGGTFSAGREATRYWDLATGASAGPTEIRTFFEEGARPVRSPDDKLVALCREGGAFKTVVLQDAQSGTEIRRFEHEDGVRAAVFSPDGRTLATSSDDGVIKLWDLGTGQLSRELRGAARPEGALSFSPDIRWLATSQSRETLYATGAKDDSVRIWDLSQGVPIHRLASPWVHSVGFSPDGRFIAGGGSGPQALQIWSVVSGERRYAVGREDPIESVAFSPDGSEILAGFDGVMAWEAVSGTPKQGLGSNAYKCGFSDNGRWALCESLSNAFELWDVSGRNLVRPLDPAAKGSCWARAVSRDGRLAAASVGGLPDGSTPAGEVTIWDVPTGRVKKHLKAHPGWTWSVAFSPDGRHMYTGGYDDGTVKTWDTGTWEPVGSFSGHVGSVEGLATSPDGKWLMSSSTDGTTCLRDAGSGEERARLIVCSGTDDWIVVTPDGLFDGSRLGVQRLVAWRFGNEILGPESFFNEFYYPGLLADILAGRRPKAPRDLARIDRRQPRLSLSLEGPFPAGGEIASRTVSVAIDVAEARRASAGETSCGARDVRLFRNGSLLHAWRGDILGGASKATLKMEIPIVAGPNLLTVYGFNGDNVKSRDIDLTVLGAESLRTPGTVHILAVGVNEYSNKDFNLKFAAADAQAFAMNVGQEQALLRRFEKVETATLLDREATKANLLYALSRLGEATKATKDQAALGSASKLTPSKPEDAVIIYFAGHGIASGARFYLVPYDLGYLGSRTQIPGDGLDTILGHSVSDEDLERVFEGIDAREMLLVIDACNSGQALEAEEKRRGPMNSRGLSQLAYEKGMNVLTAAQGYQAALEAEELGHGYLTYALVEEGLKASSADRFPADGLVEVREWFDYAVNRVPEMQLALMEDSQKAGREVAFIDGEQTVPQVNLRNLQRPRVFYRRESRTNPLIVAVINE